MPYYFHAMPPLFAAAAIDAAILIFIDAAISSFLAIFFRCHDTDDFLSILFHFLQILSFAAIATLFIYASITLFAAMPPY